MPLLEAVHRVLYVQVKTHFQFGAASPNADSFLYYSSIIFVSAISYIFILPFFILLSRNCFYSPEFPETGDGLRWTYHFCTAAHLWGSFWSDPNVMVQPFSVVATVWSMKVRRCNLEKVQIQAETGRISALHLKSAENWTTVLDP